MDKNQLIEIFGSYQTWMMKPGTWIINFMNGTENLYLIEGDEKALLVDTGYAIGNLRAFVEKITDKPIVVVNTHFHPDHSGGNGEWEEVLVSEDWEKDVMSVADGVGDQSALPYPDYKKVPLKDGDIIELGNRAIKVFKAKDAHCHSHIYLLDSKERIFIMGDEMDAWQVLLFENSHNPELEAIEDLELILKNFKDNLELAKSLDDQYDILLGNHNGAVFDKSYIDDFMELVDGIYTGTTTICENLEHKYIERNPMSKTLCRLRHKKASVFVRRALLEKIYGSKN